MCLDAQEVSEPLDIALLDENAVANTGGIPYRTYWWVAVILSICIWRSHQSGPLSSLF